MTIVILNLKDPFLQQNNYIDRKIQHTIKIQEIYNKIFTNAVIGFPGSAHDFRVFPNSNSVIFIDVEQHRKYRKYFPVDEFHHVADSVYPLLKWIMKPYENNDALNARKRNFNTKLSQTRMVVEHTFELFKLR